MSRNQQNLQIVCCVHLNLMQNRHIKILFTYLYAKYTVLWKRLEQFIFSLHLARKQVQ